jgi:hypothetical protein
MRVYASIWYRDNYAFALRYLIGLIRSQIA